MTQKQSWFDADLGCWIVIIVGLVLFIGFAIRASENRIEAERTKCEARGDTLLVFRLETVCLRKDAIGR